MNAPRPDPDVTQLRKVTDVETLKVLADPLRLAILTALMNRTSEPPRVLSVKELAHELGEPQTKLYRHIKQLESAGLIKVGASRMVSGILEQRYQACQHDLTFGPGLLRDQPASREAEALAETESLIIALLDRYRSEFFAAHRARPGRSQEHPPEQAYRDSALSITETRVSPKLAATIRLKLQQVLDELNRPGAEDPAGVPVNVLIGFFSPADPADSPGPATD